MEDLKDTYGSAMSMLGGPYDTKDWELDGLNEQGFPSIKSKEQNTSFSFITFNIGKDEEE
jgi:hypothetical protein